MAISATVFRKDIYRMLDQVLATGEPLEVKRKRGTVKIVAERSPSKMERLKKHACIEGDPEDLVHSDWTGEWQP